MAEVRLVPADKEGRVQAEEVVIAPLHRPREDTVADVDGVEVGTPARGGDRVLHLADGDVDANARKKT